MAGQLRGTSTRKRMARAVTRVSRPPLEQEEEASASRVVVNSCEESSRVLVALVVALGFAFWCSSLPEC
jgi:hypothetical protein